MHAKPLQQKLSAFTTLDPYGAGLWRISPAFALP